MMQIEGNREALNVVILSAKVALSAGVKGNVSAPSLNFLF